MTKMSSVSAPTELLSFLKRIELIEEYNIHEIKYIKDKEKISKISLLFPFDSWKVFVTNGRLYYKSNNVFFLK